LALGRQAELRLAVIPQEEPGSFRPSTRLVVTGPCDPAAKIQLVGAGIHPDVHR
jgi:hypothetical protein